METDVRDILDAAIVNSLSEIDNLDAGTQERTAEVENLAKLYRLRIEEGKSDREYYDKQENRNLNEKQLTEQKKNRWTDAVVKVGCFAAQIFALGVFFSTGLKFEETGAIGSSGMRWLMQQIKFPRK